MSSLDRHKYEKRILPVRGAFAPPDSLAFHQVISYLLNLWSHDKYSSNMKSGRPKGITNTNSKSYGPLGYLIRRARLQQKLGLADVAQACRCSVQFISNIEHGRAPLPWNKASALAQALKLSLDDVKMANLAIRSDFASCVGLSMEKRNKRKAMRSFNSITSVMSLISSDTALQEILKLYQNAPHNSKKKFVQAALQLLQS